MFGTVIMHQQHSELMKIPLPFMFSTYKTFGNKIKDLFSGFGGGKPKNLTADNLKQILPAMEPPEEWFKKR